MPTYEEIFGPTYDQISDYPEEYLNKKISYPIKRSKEPRFGEAPRGRLDDIIAGTERAGKKAPEQADPADPENGVVSKEQGIVTTPGNTNEKVRQSVETVSEQTQKRKQPVTSVNYVSKYKTGMPVSSNKTGKSGDNVI